MIGVGLIGTGRIGRLHAETLARSPLSKLVALTDVNADAAAQCAQEWGTVAVPGLDDLLSHPDVQAVMICSSTDTHPDFIERCARARKHVFCEKPIGSDLERIDRVLQTVEDAKVKLMVGFNRRFDPNHERIRKGLQAGEIGTPHLLHIISRDPAPPPISYVKQSGGLFFDMTIHDFDMARFLLGEVEEVFATAAVRVDPAIGEAGDVDTAILVLKFANGCLGTIDNSRQAVYGYDQRVEVFGDKGCLRSENVFADQVQLLGSERVQRGVPLNFFMERYRDSYRIEMEAFLRCIADDTPPPVTGEDGRAPVVLAQAAKRSMLENRPVKLT